MYCPKCNQNFEEGSRRFCPTDGARLVSEASKARETKGGIFSNLIPQMEGISDLGKALSDVPGVVVSDLERGTEPEPTNDNEDDVFFEMDDLEPAAAKPSPKEVDHSLTVETSAEAGVKSAVHQKEAAPVKKVDPSKIPAGHVVLGQREYVPAAFPDLKMDEPDAFVGRVVKGRYRVIEYLGGDENGLAYLAQDRIVSDKDKKVVVRVLKRGDADELIDSILAEERVSLAHFSHPNIARMIDSGELADGNFFLISEYVDALSVADILEIHGKFSTHRASRLIRQIANALNEAHQEGILHRDVRPENIIVEPGAGGTEQAKLVNFGASRGEPNDRNVWFQAPEVLDGRINTIVSDIYSLGIVSFQMLTGHLPFEGSNSKEVLKSQYEGIGSKATALRPELPDSINQVFDKALSFAPPGRYKKAREFGDAIQSALAESQVSESETSGERKIIDLKPLVPPVVTAAVEREPVPQTTARSESERPRAEERRSVPEKQSVAEKSRFGTYAVWAAVLAVIAAMAAGYYYLSIAPAGTNTASSGSPGASTNADPATTSGDVAPLSRSLAQPPDTNVYQNSKDNLKGDLVDNFVGFTLFYPKNWEVNNPAPGGSGDARGKFLDISRSTPDGRLQEQMLVSYYPSKGTFGADAEIFPQMVNETNQTLEKILPGYQMVWQGETLLNGSWRAYEVKFQGGGTSPSGEKLVVWGRRLFVPVARAGSRNGFEITMLATSLAKNVQSVDEVGTRGELGPILYSFEPSKNF